MVGLISVPASNLVSATGLTADECAAVEFLSIGAHAVRRGSVTNGDRVLVVGAGPIGLGAALFARLTGAEVFVLDLDSQRAKVAERVIGANALETIGASKDIAASRVGGEGFDVVFDASGNARAIESGFDWVAHGGRYVLISVVKGSITFKDPDFHRKETSLFASRNATAEDFEHVMRSIRSGEVPVDQLITHRTSLRAAVADIPRWATEKSGLIKAVVEID